LRKGKRATVCTTAASNEVPLICSGPLDLSAQDKIASALRSAPPMDFQGSIRPCEGSMINSMLPQLVRSPTDVTLGP